MNRRMFFAAGGAVAALAPLGLWTANTGAANGAASGKREDPALPQDGPKWFTNALVQTDDGRTVRFYDDLLKDKIVLINFFFTGCDAICPLMTANLVKVQGLLGPRMGRDIFMYSISLQPHTDTPETIRSYAVSHGVRPGWSFLTGQPRDIERLQHRLGFVDSDPVQDADLEQHIGTVRIANVPLHRWAMSPALSNPEVIVRTVSRVIPGGL